MSDARNATPAGRSASGGRRGLPGFLRPLAGSRLRTGCAGRKAGTGTSAPARSCRPACRRCRPQPPGASTRFGLCIVLFAAVLAAPPSALSQTAPSPGEIARYDGLLLAAHEGDLATVAAALAAGADPNRRDANLRTAAHIAAFASHDDVLAALAEAGTDMNALDAQRYDVITIAAVANDPALVAQAIRLGNRPDLVTSIYDGTALIAAAHLGHHAVIRVLVENGAPLDHVNNLGWTAVMEAVVLGDGGPDHIETVRLLVEAGADVTIPDRAGAIPLDHARARGYSEIAALLAAAR